MKPGVEYKQTCFLQFDEYRRCCIPVFLLLQKFLASDKAVHSDVGCSSNFRDSVIYSRNIDDCEHENVIICVLKTVWVCPTEENTAYCLTSCYYENDR